MIPLAFRLCTACLFSRGRCRCPYFHAFRLGTPWTFRGTIDHRRPNPFLQQDAA